MAEAKCATTTPDVTENDEGRRPITDFLKAWRKSFFRRFFNFSNLVSNGMWPTSKYYLCVTTVIFSVLLINDWQWAQPVSSRLKYILEVLNFNDCIPYIVRIIVTSLVGGIIFFIILMYTRRWLLRILLSYRGWMYEPLRKTSKKSLIWGLIVRLVSGYQPTTYSYQKSLPFLPVPNLKETLDKFITSIEPLYGPDSEEVAKFRQQAKDFRRTMGQKMQRILVLKSWWAQNWISDWWQKYIYLMGRTPIAINSNYYILDHGYWQPTHRQVSRAANQIYTYMTVKRDLDREKLPPLVLRGTVPLCMSQYENVFSVTRVPGEDVDKLVKYKASKHIVVSRNGVYYKLDLIDNAGNPLLPQNIEKQLQWIINDAELHEGDYSDAEKAIASLTGIERTEWARCRQEFFKSGVNKESLDIIESSVFYVVLEKSSYKTNPERGKFLLHGDGKTIWFDKSFNLIVFSDGKCGLNAEHSWGDAPVIGHFSEYTLTNELMGYHANYESRTPWTQCRVKESIYDDNGFCRPITVLPQTSFKHPVRLVWDFSEALKLKISRSISFNQKNNADLELTIVDHKHYGKGFIKTCKVSPDAFVQCAIQLAYFKENDKFALTYEASMTRLYLNGRTETVRSLTNETADFVRAMQDKKISKQEKIELLQNACSIHQNLYRDAMAGKGIDRHLFGLYIACKGLGYESEFLKNALTLPWTLSTSQQPQQQIANSPNCSDAQFEDMICPGGGFGPVSDDGYGISYMIPGDHRIFFHVSSKKSVAHTNSHRFSKILVESLTEMRQLFEPDYIIKSDL